MPFDYATESKRIREEMERDRNDPRAWEALVDRIAAAAHCLPSSFPGGNTHIVDAVLAMDTELKELRQKLAGKNTCEHVWQESGHGFKYCIHCNEKRN